MPDSDQTTNIEATFDIYTSRQIVIKKERKFWDDEIEGLIAVVKGYNVDRPAVSKIEEKLALEKRLQEGSRWFYIIAGLSLLNSVVLVAGGSINFLVGLGITQIIDGFSIALADDLGAGSGSIIRFIAFVLDILIASVFAVLGILSKRHKWSFIVGMVIYALDGVLFLVFKDFLSFGFHILAFLGLFNGFKTLNQMQKSQSNFANNLSTMKQIQ
jgi:hypothetical protein